MIENNISELVFHFKKNDPLFEGSDYKILIESLETTISEINKKFFDNKIECRLVVLTNVDGSFKAVNGILVKGTKLAKNTIATLGVMGGLLAITESQNFTGFMSGALNKDINHYKNGKEVGELLHDIVISIFSTENEKLEPLLPENSNLDKIIKAKSNFYEMCHSRPEIKALGFNHEENYPIQRSDFLKHTTKDRIRDQESDFIICECTIISPVDVNKKLKWTLEEKTNKSKINAYMMDASFKKRFLSGDFPLKETNKDDQMSVLLEYKKQEKNGEIVITEIQIHTVYSFNDETILAIPKDLPKGTKFIKSIKAPLEELWSN